MTYCSGYPSNRKVKLSQRLVNARKKADLSQAQLAKLLDVSTGTVAGWETGAHGIQIGRVGQVAKILKLKPSDLIADMLGELSS